MNKLIRAGALSLALALVAVTAGGCAGELQKFKSAVSMVTGTTVAPTTIIVAANAFNGVKATATNYLRYCKTNLSRSECSANNRRNVIKYVRAGTAARNQLETYLTTNSDAPATIYNALIAAYQALSDPTQTPVTTVGAAQ
jgi:hypothetical protein